MNTIKQAAANEFKANILAMVAKKDAAYHSMINKTCKALFELTGEYFSFGKFVK